MNKIITSIFCVIICHNLHAVDKTTQTDFEQLKNEIALLQKKLIDLENKYEIANQGGQHIQRRVIKDHSHSATAIKNDENKQQHITPLQPKHWRIPGTATQVSIGGFAKLTGTKDFNGSTALEGDSSGSGRHFLCARNIGLGDAATPSKDFYMHARESRIWISTLSPIDNDAIKTHIEMDFIGDRTSASTVANGYDLRLRKAYAEFNGFLVGQTFTTFADIPTFGETIDANGAIGNCQIRQPMLRYSYLDSAKNQFEIAIENAESEFISPKGVLLGTGSSTTSIPYPENYKGENRLPNLITTFTYNQNWGYLKVAGLISENAIREKIYTAVHRKMAGALAFYGMCKIADMDQFTFQMAYGSGAGRYFTEPLKASTYFDGRQLYNNKTFRIASSYKHQWCKKYNIRSTIAIAYMKNINCDELKNNIDLSPTPAQDKINLECARQINKDIRSLHINLIGNINPMTQIGAEYIFAKRRAESNESGKLHRMNLAVQVNF